MEHGKPPAGRRRESRYPAQITARIAGDVKARLEALADQELVAVGIIVRRAIEAGLPVIERHRRQRCAGDHRRANG